MGKSIRVSNGKEAFEINDTDLQSAVNDGFLPMERVIVANSKTKEVFEIDPADLPNALKDGFSFSDTKPEAVKLPPVPKDAYDFNKVLQPVSNTVLPQPKTIQGVNDTNEVQDYEATQKNYVQTQKKIAEVDKGDYGFLVPNILIDAERELMDDINPNRKFAREEKKKQLEQQETIQEQQKIKAVKAMRPKVDAVVQEATNKVDQFVKSSFEGFSIPDPIKIDAYAKEQAKKYGVGEEGFFKTLVYNEVHAAVQSKIIEPLVDKKFHDIYLKANGKPVEDDLAADFNKGFVKGEQIKGTATAQADLVFNTIQTDTKSKADQLHEAALQKTTSITDALKSTEAAIDSQFGFLIKEGKFVGSAEQFQQYQSAIENYKTQAESSQSSLQQINKQFLNELNIINTKNTAQYRRQIKEISIGADAKLKAAATEYESSYLRDPAIQKKVETAYKQAYTEVMKGREDAKGIRSNFDPAIINLFKTYTSAFGSSIKNISTTFNFPSGKLLGEYLESEFQVGNTSLKKIVDLFDAQKFAKSTGQLFGGMTPSIIASVGTVAATRGSGASTALQLLASGAAGWAAETVDIVGGMYNDKFAETGDASKAKNAANQSLQSQILLAPTYALEGLPFMGKAIKLGKNALTRALLGGAVEFATEITQEYPQNLFEESIKKDGTLATAFNYHSSQRLKETALNIAPVFLLGAYGQAKESLLEKDQKQDYIKASAKAFAQKLNFAKFAPGQREQFLFDMMQRQGENFTSAYLLSSFTSGQIDKATFNEMSKALTTSADILNKSKDLNLSPAEQKIFTAFTFQYNKAKTAFENESDPLLKKAAEGIMKDYEAQVTNFASKKQADYSVLTYANNEQYVYTHGEMENALNDYEFSKAVSNGEMKVAVFGNGEQLKAKVQSLLDLTPKQKAALDLQAQMKAELEGIDFGNVKEEIKSTDKTPEKKEAQSRIEATAEGLDNLSEIEDKPEPKTWQSPEGEIHPIVAVGDKVKYEGKDYIVTAGNDPNSWDNDFLRGDNVPYFRGMPIGEKQDGLLHTNRLDVFDELQKAQTEQEKPIESKVEVLKNVAIKGMSDKMEGRLLNTQQAEELQKEIESNYSTGVQFNGKNNDIRQNLFNYGNPMSEKTINGVNLRIGEGLIRDNKKTYLLYADGKIIGEFYSKNDIYAIVKYIENNLISDTAKFKKKRKKPTQHKDPIVIAALEIDPVSPDIIVAQHFINGGTIGSIAIQELFGGKKMVGKKKIKGEMTSRISYIRKDGLGIDGLGDKLWDGASEEVHNMYDSQDFSNAVEQYVRDFTHRKQMAEDLVNRYGGHEITEEAKQAANYENFYGPALDELTPEQLEILTDENNSEGVDFQDEIAQLEAENEQLIADDKELENVELIAEEKAVANEQINNEIAVQIINDNKLTLDNLEENIDRLFKGFPYEPQDYEAIKKLLSNDRPNNQESAANEQQGVGDADNQKAGVDGKKDGDKGKDKGIAATNTENNRGGKDQVPGDQEIKALEKSVADAKKELSAAEGKLAAQQGKQADLFAGGVQKEMFVADGSEAKSILDPLKRNLKEAEAALEKAKNREIKDERQGALDLEAPLNIKELSKNVKLKEPEETKSSRVGTAEQKAINKVEDLQDVGEKIGGAKKDLAERLGEVTPEELSSKPLSKVFPRPDFKKLVEEGSLSQDAAILLNFIYDKIPAKPRNPYRVPNWVKTVEGTLQATKSILEAESEKNTFFINEIENAFARSLKDGFQLYSDTMKGLGFPTNQVNLGGYEIKKFENNSKWNKETQKLEPVEGVRYTIVSGSTIIRDFLSMDDAINGLKAILNKSEEKTKGTKFDVYQDRNTKEFFIGKKGAINVVRIVSGFNTLGEARTFLKQEQSDIQGLWDAMKAPKERRMANRQRVGVDWRKGKNIDSKEFANTFGFRGVEFGNWVNNTERQSHVNEAYDALMDLASVIGVSPRALSLNGELGFAFGARGSGKANAHYEAGKVVINLTKTRGAGSLAHEWWHALDNYFSRNRGQKESFITEIPIDRINNDGSRNQGVRKEMIDAFKSVMDAIKSTKLKKRSEVLDRARSDAYWSTSIEMSARSFENYIIEQLGQRNQQNDYLANFKETAEWISDTNGEIDALKNYPYPLTEESHTINESFKQFFETIKEDASSEKKPLFSPKSSIKVEKPSNVPASVQNMRKAFPDAVVVQNQSDLPQTIQDEAAKQGIAVEGVYFEGKVYLVAENMDDMGRAEAVYRHERIGHQGVIAHFKNNIASFANSLVDGASKAQLDKVNAIAQKMFGKNADELTIAQKSIVGQEYIAQMAENPTESPKTWAKVVAWVRETLRSLGIDLSVTDNEIKVLLAKVAQNQQAAFKQTKGEVLFMNVNGEMTKVVTMPDVVNGFYSPLEKVIRNTKFDKLPAKQWLEKFAVGEEAKWTGLSDWLSTQEGSVSKADIKKYLEGNRIQVVEVVNGTKPKLTVSKSSNGLYYAINVVSMEPLWGPFKTEQAANDYIAKESMPREQRLEAIRTEFNANTYGYFLTEDMAGDVIVEDKDGEFVEGELPNARLQALAEEYYEVNESSDQSDDTKYSGWQLEGEKGNYKEVLVTMPSKSKPQTLIESLQKEKEQFKSSHFDEPNILVHLRINTRTDVDGNKVLFLEEVQSDWGQKGKKEGFKEPHFNWDSQLGKDAVEVLKEIAIIAGFPDWKQLATAMTKSSDVLNDFPIPWDKKDLILSWLKSVNQEIKVPSAPFVTNTNAWTKLGLKVALKEAVKQGADKIAWTTGEQQNERYNLKKIFSRIVIDVEEGLYEVHGYDLIGKKSIEYGSIKKENLQEYVGKELAEKAIQDGGGDYRGLNLEVGGKGMKGFYGSPAEGSLGIVGNVAKSLFKQEPKTVKLANDNKIGTFFQDWVDIEYPHLGSRPKVDDLIREYDTKFKSTQHSIDITPELKAQVEQGLPLFSGKAVNQIAKEAAHFIKEMQAKGKTMAEMVDAATDYMEENWDDQWEPFDRDSWRDLFVAGINKKNAQLKATDGAKPTPAQISIAKAKYAAAIRKDENKKPNLFSRSWQVFRNLSFYIDNPNRYITMLQQSIEKAYDIRTNFKVPLGRLFEQNATGQGYYQVREFLNAVTAGLNKKQLDNFKEYLFAMRTKDRLNQSIHNNAFGIEAANREVGNITLTEANILLDSLKQKIGAEAFADFEKRGANMQRLMDQMLQRLVESGILSQEAYDEIKMQNDFYAPFNVLQKIARYDDGTGVAVPSNTIKKIKGIKAVDGVYSLEDLKKLQDASNEDLLDANGQVQKNADGTNVKVITRDELYKAGAAILDDLLDAGVITDKQYIEEMAKMGDSGFEISDILDKTANIIFDSYRKAHRNELMKRLSDLAKLDTEGIVMQSVNGFELRYDKNGKASSVPKRLSDIKVPEGFGVIGYRVAGKQKFLAIELKAANTINGLDKVTLPGWMKGVNFMNVVFRTAVITLSLPFQVSNFVIDTYRSLMFSRYGLLAGKSMTDRIANLVLLVPQYMNAFMVSGAANAGKHTELFKEFMKSGAYSAGQFDDPFTSQKILKVGKKSFFQHIKFGGLDKVFKLFEGIGRTFEQTQKIVMFERGMDIDAGIRMGVSRWKNIISEAKTPDDMMTALDQIAYEIQNFAGSPNFPATNGLMKVIGVIFQFFSARVKGEMSDSRRIAAMFGANTEGVKMTASERMQMLVQFAAMATPIIYMALKNIDDDDDEEEYLTLSPYDRLNNMIFPTGTFDYEDDDGNITTHREMVKVPLRGITSTINSLAVDFSRYAKSKDPALLKHALVQLAGNLSPLNINNTDYLGESIFSNLTWIPKSALEITNNRNYFLHEDLIPDRFNMKGVGMTMKKAKEKGIIEPYYVFTKRTPDWAIEWSKGIYESSGISITPVALDYWHRNVFGNIVNKLDLESVKGRILRSESNTPVWQNR